MPLTNLHPANMTEAQFYAILKDVLSQLEGKHTEPYFDTNAVPKPTIGIGFNLRDAAVRTNVFDAMGLTNAQREAATKVLTDTSITTNADLQSKLKAAIGRDFVMSEDNIKAVFEIEAEKRAESVKTSSGVGFSYELIALVSLQYSAVYGPNLKALLASTGDSAQIRADAWYDIRYGSNKDTEHGKRRYVEAALFGLYNDKANITPDDAKAVYRMLSLHRKEILVYEATYANWLPAADAELSAAGLSSVTSAQTLAKALGGDNGNGLAKGALLTDLESHYSGLTALVSNIGATNIYLNPAKATDSNRSGTIDASVFEAYYSDKNDLLVGLDQSDILKAGQGDDYLIGGAGSDKLDGGIGYDTYVFKSGEGKDTIIDSDGAGRIMVAGEQLTGATYAKHSLDGRTQIWVSDDGKTTYTYVPGSSGTTTGTLTIVSALLGDGQITLSNFDLAKAKDGVLGIKLGQKTAIQIATEASAFFKTARESESKTTALLEAQGKTLRCYLNAPGHTGDIIKFSLAGGDASKFGICTGDDTITFANGEVSIELQEGQTEISFAFLNLGDVDTDGALQLTATYQPVGGESATNTLTINFDATDESATQAPQTTRDIVGDIGPMDFYDANGNVYHQYDDLGNLVTDPSKAGARSDTLYDSAGNDHLTAGEGNDKVVATRGGDDLIDAGAGDDDVELGVGNGKALGGSGADILTGRAGNDVLEGGDGSDIVTGDEGDDLVYADSAIALDEALVRNKTQAGSGVKGDWLDGGDGRDLAIGGAGNDVLAGGGGGDTLIGGGGDDLLLGDTERNVVYRDWSVGREVVPQPDSTLYRYTFSQASVAESASGEADALYGGAGNDWIMSGAGDDFADGGADDDVLFGEIGNDVLLGGAGNDKINGDDAGLPIALHGNDFLDGGEGDDQLYGQGGSDVLFGGAGDDKLNADSGDENAGDDYLDGEDGDDALYGGALADMLYGGAGNDTLLGDENDTAADKQGDDTLDGEDGNDKLYGMGGSDTLYGGAGDDLLAGDVSDTPETAMGDDYLDGEDGDDELHGGGGADILYGGAGKDKLYGDDSDTPSTKMGNDLLDGQGGDDQLAGYGGNDTLIGGDGDDILFGDASELAGASHGADFLDGGAGADQMVGGGGADTLSGGDGNDVMLGDDSALAGAFHGADVLDGGSGDDTLIGGGGSDALQGGDGADILFGDANEVLLAYHGNDTLDGGAGNDSLIGGRGADSLAGGDGDDELLGDDGQGLVGEDDTLAGGAGADKLYGDGGNDTLEGGDGNDLLVGGVGDDRLDGGEGDDTLVAGDGEDTLLGGGGNDVYIIKAGSGIKHISDSGGDSNLLVIEGATFGMVVLRLGSLLIDTGVAGGEIHLDDFDPDDPLGSQSIQRFQFDDGIFTYAQLLAKGLSLNGTPDADVISGTGLDDRIELLASDDLAYAAAGNDSVQGGEGNDSLYGEAGNDQLDGGTGADLMVGGEVAPLSWTGYRDL